MSHWSGLGARRGPRQIKLHLSPTLIVNDDVEHWWPRYLVFALLIDGRLSKRDLGIKRVVWS